MRKGPPSGAASFWAVLLIGWAALGVAGVLYARFKGIPGWVAGPVLAAFLITYPFYLVPAFPNLREHLAGRRLPYYLVATAVLPYLACCFGAVQFQWESLARVVAVALLFSLWYVVLPASAATDLLFLALIPVVLLGRYFNSVYVPLYPPFKDVILLGHITLIEIVIMVLMLERRVPAAGYGFMPNLKEWRVGALHYLYFVPIGLPLALLLKAVHLTPPAPWWKILGTFFGFLWVIGLSEEFFFRGVLQPWIERWTWNRTAALLITSAAYGLVHISFGGHFPNWSWVAVAGILGWFCGRARNQAGSIGAGVVTHALVVTTWRAFFAA